MEIGGYAGGHFKIRNYKAFCNKMDGNALHSVSRVAMDLFLKNNQVKTPNNIYLER